MILCSFNRELGLIVRDISPSGCAARDGRLEVIIVTAYFFLVVAGCQKKFFVMLREGLLQNYNSLILFTKLNNCNLRFYKINTKL